MTPDEALAIADGEPSNSHPLALVALAAEVRRLRGVVETLCGDVEAYIGAEYPHRDRYPNQRQKYEAGMAEIREYMRSVGVRPGEKSRDD